MKLSEALKGVEAGSPIIDCEVTDVCSDSRKITKDCVFVCIKGEKFDGHDHADEAVSKGAAAVICEHPVGVGNQILVADSRFAYAVLCANFCGSPERRMKFIGVTGTNGKTTTTNLIKGILTHAGHKVGLIGTIQNEIGDEIVPAHRTTPDAHELYHLFLRMADSGCDTVVMEVSSHALHQNRLGNLPFEIGVFTNLTQDHLDYHGTMEEYYKAKKLLFDRTKTAVINIDDAYGKRLMEEVPCGAKSYSAKQASANYFAGDITCLVSSVHYQLQFGEKQTAVNFSMPGRFSVYNSLASAAACIEFGVDGEQVLEYLNGSSGVRGRSEVIPTGRDFSVICDYAHTPDGLDNILPALKENAVGRLITLFGCGGDRDKTKRPMMGESAAKYSDFVIVTSDNPRTEDPVKIIDDILPGITKYDTPYVVIPDRYEAIVYALHEAKKDDLIILAGKGHEDYQAIGEEEIHFDEHEIVAEILKTM